MPTAPPRPYRRNSIFGDGPRLPLCRERRAVWKARLELHRRAGRITDGHAQVAIALLKRLGQDGRCDPSHETLADDSGEARRTVRRALNAMQSLGMVTWARRLVRAGWRAAQTSNAYRLTVGEPPRIPPDACGGHSGRVTRKDRSPSVQPAPAAASPTHRAALEGLARDRQAAFNAAWLARKGQPAGYTARKYAQEGVAPNRERRGRRICGPDSFGGFAK